MISRAKVSDVPAAILNYELPVCVFCRQSIPSVPFGIKSHDGFVVRNGGVAHFWCLADHEHEARR